MQVRSLDQVDPLVKEMATYSSILVWEIPWTEESGGASVHWVAKRVGRDLATKKASLVDQLVKNPPARQETLIRFLGQENTLEEGSATHSNILRLPWWLRL